MINPNKLKGRKIWEMNVDLPIVPVKILFYNQFYTLRRRLLKNFERGGLNERV